nr:unnamed protein product [Digitaria exilis]
MSKKPKARNGPRPARPGKPGPPPQHAGRPSPARTVTSGPARAPAHQATTPCPPTHAHAHAHTHTSFVPPVNAGLGRRRSTVAGPAGPGPVGPPRARARPGRPFGHL